MTTMEKVMVLALVKASKISKSQTLAEIGIPRRTYYNWVRQEKTGEESSVKRRPWNRIMEGEEQLVLERARASPELSSRQLSLKLIDDYGCWISESTVYRILKREGLVKTAEIKGFAAGKEYQRKTRKPNEMWIRRSSNHNHQLA